MDKIFKPVICTSTNSYSNTVNAGAPTTLAEAQLRLRHIQDAAFSRVPHLQRLKKIQALIKKPYKEDPAD